MRLDLTIPHRFGYGKVIVFAGPDDQIDRVEPEDRVDDGLPEALHEFTPIGSLVEI